MTDSPLIVIDDEKKKAVREKVRAFLEKARAHGLFSCDTALATVIFRPEGNGSISFTVDLKPGDLATAVMLEQHAGQSNIPPHDVGEGEPPCRCYLQEAGTKFICMAVFDEYASDICRASDGMVFSADQIVINRQHRHKGCTVRKELQ